MARKPNKPNPATARWLINTAPCWPGDSSTGQSSTPPCAQLERAVDTDSQRQHTGDRLGLWVLRTESKNCYTVSPNYSNLRGTLSPGS